MESPVIITVAGILLNLLVIIIGGVWKLSRLEIALREAINKTSKETDEQIERHVRYFGESVAAVRQKITEVELFARDTFVRRDEIRTMMEGLNEKVERLLAK